MTTIRTQARSWSFIGSTVTVTATGDNTVDVYHNGVSVQHGPVWEYAVSATLTDTCVLAMAVTNVGGPGGLLASTNTGVVTDETWKCSGTEQTGWYLENFDDSSWDSAYIVGTHGDQPWGVIAGIDGIAKWIWDTGYAPGHATTYCRKTICDGMLNTLSVYT